MVECVTRTVTTATRHLVLRFLQCLLFAISFTSLEALFVLQFPVLPSAAVSWRDGDGDAAIMMNMKMSDEDGDGVDGDEN